MDTLELEERLADRSCIDSDAHAAVAALKKHRERMEKAREIVRHHVHPQKSGTGLHYDMQRLADLLLGGEAERIREGQRACAEPCPAPSAGEMVLVGDPICRQCAGGEPGIPEVCTCGDAEDPTSRGDRRAEAMRQYYEDHRETWWQRLWCRTDQADNLMLGLLQVADATAKLLPRREPKP